MPFENTLLSNDGKITHCTIPIETFHWISALETADRLYRIGSIQAIGENGTKLKGESVTYALPFSLVRMAGLEPARPIEHQHLKLASLPIPAHPHLHPVWGTMIL